MTRELVVDGNTIFLFPAQPQSICIDPLDVTILRVLFDNCIYMLELRMDNPEDSREMYKRIFLMCSNIDECTNKISINASGVNELIYSRVSPLFQNDHYVFYCWANEKMAELRGLETGLEIKFDEEMHRRTERSGFGPAFFRVMLITKIIGIGNEHFSYTVELIDDHNLDKHQLSLIDEDNRIAKAHYMLFRIAASAGKCGYAVVDFASPDEKIFKRYCLLKDEKYYGSGAINQDSIKPIQYVDKSFTFTLYDSERIELRDVAVGELVKVPFHAYCIVGIVLSHNRDSGTVDVRPLHDVDIKKLELLSIRYTKWSVNLSERLDVYRYKHYMSTPAPSVGESFYGE